MQKLIYSWFIIVFLTSILLSCDAPEPPIEPLPSFEDDNYRIGYWLETGEQALDTIQFIDETHLIFREGQYISEVIGYEILEDTLYMYEQNVTDPIKYPYEFNNETGDLVIYFKHHVSGYIPVDFIKIW